MKKNAKMVLMLSLLVVMFYGCSSSPAPARINYWTPGSGVYFNPYTAEEIHISEPVNMSGSFSFLGTTRNGTYNLSINADGVYLITLRFSDGTINTGFFSNYGRIFRYDGVQWSRK